MVTIWKLVYTSLPYTNTPPPHPPPNPLSPLNSPLERSFQFNSRSSLPLWPRDLLRSCYSQSLFQLCLGSVRFRTTHTAKDRAPNKPHICNEFQALQNLIFKRICRASELLSTQISVVNRKLVAVASLASLWNNLTTPCSARNCSMLLHCYDMWTDSYVCITSCGRDRIRVHNGKKAIWQR